MEHSNSRSTAAIGHVQRPQIPLTSREVEVLKWTAQGNTAEEVAMILNLKARTVHFYIGNAIRKMGVRNKTCAAVQAALSGVF